MGRVVVDDGLDQLACWDIALDGVEEADELLVPVPLHAPSDHPPVQHVQRREQRGRAMPLISPLTKSALLDSVAAWLLRISYRWRLVGSGLGSRTWW
jgi:hypothetical protein